MASTLLATDAAAATANLLPLSRGFVAHDQPVVAIVNATVIEGRRTPSSMTGRW